MSVPSGDGGSAAMQELLAHLSRRPQQSPRSENVPAAPPFSVASPTPSRTLSAQLGAAPLQNFSINSPSTAAAAGMAAGVDPTGQDRKAHLLGLLNFGGQKETASPTQSARSSLPISGNAAGNQQHVRGVSASDLVGTSMGKPTGHEETTPSPPADASAAGSAVFTPNPQDQLLQLLGKSQHQQRPVMSPRTSLPGDVTLPVAVPNQAPAGPAVSPLPSASAKASPVIDTGLAGTVSPAPNRDSPIRVFGSRESREPTPFDPPDLSTPTAKPADKGMFTYVNPFEQLALSRNKNNGSNGHVSNGNVPEPKRRSAGSSPAAEPIREEVAVSVEIPSPAPVTEERGRVEALMGIGAPTTDPEVVSQAIKNISGHVEKQAAFESDQGRSDTQPRKKSKKKSSPNPQQAVEVTNEDKSHQQDEIQLEQEANTEAVRQAMDRLSTQDAQEALQDLIDEAAAAADDEESSANDDEYQVVPVYNIPLKPFVAIELTQQDEPSLSFRERSVTDIARVKKEFDQIDRCLVTASNDYIVYATPKKPYGVRVIQQEDGKDRQYFKENDPIFNVAISSSPSGKTHQGIETIIATGTSGTVYWSVTRYDGRDQSQDDDIAKHCLVFPPFVGHDGDHTSGGQLKTRAKRSNRHPEYFAIGRGKTIQIVFPFHAMSSKFVKKGSVVDTEGYFKERSIKISTGKAGKDFTFSEDDTVLASLDKAGRLRFWDVRDLVEEDNGTASKLAPMEVNTPIMTVPTAHVNDKAWPTSVLFVDKLRPYVRGSALRYVIVGMKQNHTLQLWDLGLGKVVQELALPHENESDAICSVAYHPATGIIVVGHPTRNSIYFIHLSAPKYNLQGITQAKYLQAIIQKNPNLPKPESTAIMSGIREYSFASRGQIRSLDLLSSQNAAVDKKPDDERGQFELYVMHSKGVTCLSIRKADLGWSNDNKVITKVNGLEEGIVKVKDLQELKPVELSEMSSVNGDAIGSTKGISSRARSPLPEPVSREREVAAANETPVNGTPGPSSSSKSERRKKKRTEHPTEEIFDDIPPPAPVPPTAAFQQQAPPRGIGNSSVSKREVRASRKEPKEIKETKEIKEEQPMASKEVAQLVPDTGATDNSIALASIQRELKQVEENVKIALSQAFEGEFKILRRGIDEDRRTAEATAAGHQEAVLRLVSQSLTENVDAALTSIVVNNIQSKVLPAVNQNTEKALRKSIPEWLHNNLQQQLLNQVKTALPEAVGNAMGNQQLLQSLTDGVTSKISKRLDREMQSTVIPQFQKVVANATTETERRAFEQLKLYEDRAQSDSAKIDKLALMTEDLLETIRRMAETQSAMRDEMATLQEEVTYLRAAQVTPPSPAALATVEAPVPDIDPYAEEVREIADLVIHGRFEDGAIKWLQSPNRETIFRRFFVKCDPSLMQECPGLVILSVGAAAVQNLDDYVAQRLDWIDTALTCLDLQDSEVKSVAGQTMDMVTSRLESRYMSLAEANYQDPLLKRIPAVVKKAKDIKAWASQK